MAILKDKNNEQTGLEIEYKLSPSEYRTYPAEWVSLDLTLKFGKGFPEIHIKRDGQEVSDIESFINDLRKLSKDEISRLDFQPLEPDYHLIIIHSGEGKHDKVDLYEVWLIIDAQGSRGGVYHYSGPAINMYTTREDMIVFAAKLNTELYKIKKVYLKNKE